MTLPAEFTPNDLLARVEKIVNSSQQNHHLLQQAVQALVQQGYKLAVDLNQIKQEQEADLRFLRAGSEKIVRELNQFQELIRISALITSSLELDKVLEDVMDTVISLTGAERAYLMLKAADSEELIIRAARNWNQETIGEADVTFSRGIIKQAMDQGQPMVTTNAQDDERFQNRASVMMNALRSIIVIPLMLQGRAVGVLYADNRLHQTVFNQSSVLLLTAFANQATIAIENARAFTRVRQALQESQQEVQRLRIQVDEGRLAKQVGEITESEYFQNLAIMAKDLRKRGKSDK